MGNLRQRLIRAELAATPKARPVGELRVSGMSLEAARAEFARRLRHAATHPKTPDHMRAELEKAADRITTKLEKRR